MAQTVTGARKAAAKNAGLSLAEYLARIENGLKRCTRCKKWNSISDFDIDRSRQDGVTASCKPCRGVSVRLKRISMESPSEVQRGHDAVRWAIRRGHLQKPTELVCQCGKQAKQYHHYKGYRRHELDVIALCISCHRKAHWRRNE